MDGKRLKKLFAHYWWLILGGVVFFLRLPSLFEPFTYGDEGIYLTLGQAIRRGLVLYRDIHDNKPPLLYLLAAVAGNFSYYRAILFFWSLATIYLFYKLSCLLFKNKNAKILSTFVFAALISIHTFEGNVGNAENFMILPTIAAILLISQISNIKYQNNNLKLKNYFIAGILFSLATLFKVPAAFDFAAILFWTFLLFLNQRQKDYSLFTIHYSLLIIGFLFPILISLIYYFSQGALNQYLKAAFFQNIPYLASWVGTQSPTLGGLPYPLLIRGILLLGGVVILFLFRKNLASSVVLVVSWFSFSLFAALLSSRPYPHYLLQVIPALALSFGLVFSKNKEKIVPLVLSFLLAFSFLYFKFWHYPNISYYRNFYQFAFGLKSKESYFDYFGKETWALYQTAAFLKLHTSPQEKIFIWSNQPSIYALANRLPTGRYTVAYHIIDFNGYEETMNALTKNPPRYIIVSAEEKRPFPEFFAFLQNNYISVFLAGEFNVLKLKK